MKVEMFLQTDGKGQWTEEERTVYINELKVCKLSTKFFPDVPVHGELRAFFIPDGFNPQEWNIHGYGLICSDKKWIREFKLGLRALGFTVRAVRNVSYTEHELQGENYVALSFGDEFYRSWKKLNTSEKV